MSPVQPPGNPSRGPSPDREGSLPRRLLTTAGVVLLALATLLLLDPAQGDYPALLEAARSLVPPALLVGGAALLLIGRRLPRRRAAVSRSDLRGPVTRGQESGGPVPDESEAVVAARPPQAASHPDALMADWAWEMDAQLRFVSNARMSGSDAPPPPLQQVGLHPWDVPGALIPPMTWEQHRATLLARKPFRDLLVRRWDEQGMPHYLLASGEPVFGTDGRFCGYRGVTKDMTEHVLAHERIMRVATIDPLTQLPNRQTFDEQAGRMLADAAGQARRFALLFIDLDNFRMLNNGYGHRVGDQVLTLVAARLRKMFADPHLLGRRGGDEFVVLLADVPARQDAARAAQTLIEALSAPMSVFGMEITATCSVGIGFFPHDGSDLPTVLNAADAAMYQAKESGRKTYAFFTPGVARRVDLRHRLEQKLRRAVEAPEFRLHYQPLVSLADGMLIGAEALIRWRDPELGEIAPGEFIQIAEESGLIVALGDWVIAEACRTRRHWRDSGMDVPPVAINFSSVQLRQLGCVEKLLEELRRHDIPPHEIEVEVTETGLLDTSAVARENLVRMCNAGVRIALDDFGVGFSSLSHLRDLPISRLKIDRSFTVECMRDARTLTIVKAVIEMARSLGITITAEGIETQAQQAWMQHLGCDSAQGFLFARALPADEFLALFVERQGGGRERSLMH